MYHIERNGNAKIILLDLSMKLTRFLHKKEEQLDDRRLDARQLDG